MSTKAADRWRIPDELWEQLEGWIPVHENTHRFGGGRPRRSNRDCLDAIFFVLRTGCQWKALDATVFVPGSTAHDRFQEWVRAGVFLKFWEMGLLEYDYFEGIDWRWLNMDGCQTKAPLGGEKNRPKSHRSRQRRRQAQPADGCRGSAHRAGRGRSQPQRLQVGAGHAGEYPGGAARPRRGRPAAPVPR